MKPLEGSVVIRDRSSFGIFPSRSRLRGVETNFIWGMALILKLVFGIKAVKPIYTV